MRVLTLLAGLAFPDNSYASSDQAQATLRREKEPEQHQWGSIGGSSPWRNNPWNVAKPPQRAQAIKDAFQFAWNGYYEFAFPNDELHPVNNSFGNSR